MSSNPADEFLSTVLFIDDEADNYNEKKNKIISFDFNKFTEEFAKNGKLCTLYAPKCMEDVDICIRLAKNADITVLDWLIDFPLPDNIDPTADVESDIRGKFAIKFLHSVLEVCKNQLKLFLVYTNESVESVFNEAKQKLQENGIETENINEEYLLKFHSVRIYFRKKDIDTKIDGKLSKGLLPVDEVPVFLTKEFENMNHGFLPEFALKCSTLIKEIIFEILNQFSDDIDYAYFDHKSCIMDADSSLDILFNLYSNVLYELLVSQSNDFLLFEKRWMNIYIKKIKDDCSEKKDIKCLLGIEPFSSTDEHKKKVGSACKRHPVVHNLLDDESKMLESFVKFARLSHLCVDFSINDNKPHILTLGTIIQDKSNGLFFLCIQQRCDSLRIMDGERKFLFLPLCKKDISITSKKQNISIILGTDIAFEVKSKSFDMHTIIFSTDKHVVESKYINNEWIYLDKEQQQYRYCGRVNEMHSLRIVRKYAESLSRIGLDEFEWFRILGE